MRRTSRKSNLSGSGFKKVSEFRRAEIHGIENKKTDKLEEINLQPAIVRGKGLNKTASFFSPVLPTTTQHTDTIGPEVYSPLYQIANMNLPRDRVTQNAWNRIFYDTHPVVRNAINLHASFPISKVNITCKNKKVEQFFNEMHENINLYDVVYGLALEFWKMGEAFPYGELDMDNGVWKRISILNPDFIHVDRPIMGGSSVVSMQPDAKLKRLVTSTNPADIQLRKSIPSHIVDFVKKNLNIPLNDVHISHLKFLSSPYDIRGTSIIVSVYKDLMLYDKLRTSKFAQADSMVNPLTLIKLGGSDGYKPTQSDIEAFRSIIESAQYDKDFKLITHDGVTIEPVGYSGAVMDISSDIDLIMSNLYTGLMVPKSLMDQEAATYASSSIGLEVLRQRYDIFRNMIKKWLERKIFAPICELQDFFEYSDGEKRLVVPTVDFNHMNLFDMQDYVQGISTFVGEEKISLQTLHRSLGLDTETEFIRIRSEAIKKTIYEKEKENLMKMSISELRALDPEKPIPELLDRSAEFAASSEPSLPGMDGGMGDMGGGDMGGLDMGALGLGDGGDMGGGEPPPPPGGEPPMM